MAAVYGVFDASESPEFEADGSVASGESVMVKLRGRALVCSSQAVAEACIQCLREEEDAKRLEDGEEVVVVEGEDNEEPRWVVVLLPIVCLGGQVWEATVLNREEGERLLAGVSGSEAAAVHMLEPIHENVRDGMRTGKECEVPVENEGQCSGCGMEWAVACHQVLTGVPPALAP